MKEQDACVFIGQGTLYFKKRGLHTEITYRNVIQRLNRYGFYTKNTPIPEDVSPALLATRIGYPFTVSFTEHFSDGSAAAHITKIESETFDAGRADQLLDILSPVLKEETRLSFHDDNDNFWYVSPDANGHLIRHMGKILYDNDLEKAAGELMKRYRISEDNKPCSELELKQDLEEMLGMK